MAHLHDALEHWALETPGAPALWWQGRSQTNSDLLASVTTLAAGIDATVDRGACLAVIADNEPALVSLMYAAPAVGRPLLLVNTRLTGTEQQRLIDDVGAELVVDLTTAEGHAALDRLARTGAAAPDIGAGSSDAPRPDDLAWIIHTSGTTGSPKGVRLTHASLLAAVDIAAVARPFADDDIYLFPFPLFHVAAYNVLHAHCRRRPVVLLPRFEVAAFCEAVEQHRVTAVSLAPTMIAMLLDWPQRRSYDLSSLRTIAYGASAIPRDVLVRGMAELGCDFTQGYGMTELSGNAVFLDAEMHRRAATDRPELLAAAGRPGPGVELRIVDTAGADVAPGEPGEILVRSPQVCDGYWGQPDATAATIVDGWLHTGDVGRIDEDGILFVVDRIKDLVVTGGENVSSREVEDVVSAHPDVGAVAVVGVPDERWGERVVAVVVPAPGRSVDPSEVVDWCRGRIAGFKRPKQVLVRDDLPLGASGKVLKREVQDWAASVAGLSPIDAVSPPPETGS